MQELAPGLWRWTAPHPDWQPGEDWGRDVGCVYYDAPSTTVLIDPLVPQDERERFLSALDRDVERARKPVAILLTVWAHERSAAELGDRYDASVWAHEREAARFDAAVTTFALPDGVEARVTADEIVLWIPEHRALVVGDVLLGTPDGGVQVCPDSWLSQHVSPAELRESLRPLLELPVERLLVAHGEPVLAEARAALAEALRA